MVIDVEHARDRYCNVSVAEDAITSSLRRLADWFYAQLRKDCVYQASEAVVAEAMEANDYIFDEHGRIAE